MPTSSDADWQQLLAKPKLHCKKGASAPEVYDEAWRFEHLPNCPAFAMAVQLYR